MPASCDFGIPPWHEEFVENDLPGNATGGSIAPRPTLRAGACGLSSTAERFGCRGRHLSGVNAVAKWAFASESPALIARENPPTIVYDGGSESLSSKSRGVVS